MIRPTNPDFGAHTMTALPEPLPADPFPLFAEWFENAREAADQPNPNAMHLATVDDQDEPQVRTVLCKAIDAQRGCIVFHTNYQSDKGRALAAHPFAAVVFHWDHAGLQVRIRGPVSRTTEAESDAYFRTRKAISQAGAWASKQSAPVNDPDELQRRTHEVLAQYNIDPLSDAVSSPSDAIPRPPHWGGFRIHARDVELWVSAEGRLHQRARWSRTITPDTAAPTAWTATRLFP